MFNRPPPTITGLGPQARQLPPPVQGLQSAFTDPYNLSHEGADQAGEYYRNQNDVDVSNNDVLGQAVHFAQRAQAQDYADSQGFKGFNQAIKERNAIIPRKGGNLQLPDSPMGTPSTFDPKFQTSAVDPIQILKRLR